VTSAWVERAQRFADDHLFPTANEIDALDVVPKERLDLLAADGWYGVGTQVSAEEMHGVLAAFAGADLTTTFVWFQHHGAVRTIQRASEALQAEWLEALCSGETRSTVAYAGLLPGAPLKARPADNGGWVLDGVAYFVSGWGLADVVHVAARTPDDDIVWLLVDMDAPGFATTPHRLLAVNASATVTLHVSGVEVPADRELSRFPYAIWPEIDAAGLRVNGSLAAGVAARCCRLLGPSPLDDELAATVAALDAGTPGTYPAVRAGMSAFAVRAASALIAAEGSRGIELGTTAERLYREAALLVVFASRPAIRSSLLAAFGAA
jgi:alkylation response protein AidB-like acyl-CoA dehydrogenase